MTPRKTAAAAPATGPRSVRSLAAHAAPRYMRVADALIAEIEQGTYPVGEMLPPELEIAEQYGVSRYTAREAIRKLTELGLITRRAGIGTTVTSATAQSNYSARISDIDELIHYAKETRLKILGEEWVKVEGPLAEVLKPAKGQTWLKVTALRYPQGSRKPFSHTTMVVQPAYARIRERIRESGAAVYRLIEEMYGERISEVKQEITCLALDKEQATLLGEKAGNPALLVYRYYLGKDSNLLSVSINIYPPDRFKLVTSWRLDWK
ncbi:GntR family transcriptional regulator [Ramlibacter sp. USB13]|uniref:GntR family transcriptional regulator n=1 Tax=Ramlibacter cellulosilyticus TaxID=2764187 RepID=A0A923MMP8_9BURK|nr:GntR family transcriptional regulator [Ramlibacter cellulosilyticus]MBC5781471.1 GntR family transcriptional regulator [Ramlibacter cellulosilyticus]